MADLVIRRPGSEQQRAESNCRPGRSFSKACSAGCVAAACSVFAAVFTAVLAAAVAALVAVPVALTSAAIVTVAAVGWSHDAHAAESKGMARLRDPMQAPANLAGTAALPTEGSDRGADASASAQDNHGEPALASIRRSMNSPARALINGQWLMAGAVFGTWRIRSIAADSVVLQSTVNTRETKVLALHHYSIRRLGSTP